MRYDERKVLLHREESHWVLPGCLRPRRDFPSVYEPPRTISIIQEEVGVPLSMVLLRHIWREVKQIDVDNEICSYEKAVILMECTERNVTSEGDSATGQKGYMWIPLQEANVYHLIWEAAEAIRREIAWAIDIAPPCNRLSWQRPKWFAVISA